MYAHFSNVCFLQTEKHFVSVSETAIQIIMVIIIIVTYFSETAP